MAKMGIVTEYAVGNAGTAGEAAVWHYNTDEKWNGTSRPIIFLHGHGNTGQDLQTPWTFGQNTGAGLSAMALARTGKYVCCSIQASGVASWSSPATLTSILNAATAMQTRGCRIGKFGIEAYSMNGLAAANIVKRYASQVAGVVAWNPVLDGDWVRSTAGHTPVAGNATWTTEYDAAFGSYAASAGYRVFDEPASYRNLGVPFKIIRATDDEVVPAQIATDFVAAVNDPMFTIRTPAITGGHTQMWGNVPDSEIVAFFDSLSW